MQCTIGIPSMHNDFTSEVFHFKECSSRAIGDVIKMIFRSFRQRRTFALNILDLLTLSLNYSAKHWCTVVL